MRHAAQASHRPAPHGTGREAGLPRALAATMATAALTVLATLSLWSVLPTLAGWHVDVVMSGSMAPAIRPGDLVLSEPVGATTLLPGQVALFRAADGRVLVHRVEQVADDGTLITRGDANGSADAAPVRAEDVLGLARLRVPWIGLPAVWFAERAWPPLVASALIAVLAVAAAADDGEEKRRGRHRAGARHLGLLPA